MDKKELILYLLTRVESYWPKAATFMSLIKNWELNDDLLDQLYKLLKQWISNVKDKQVQLKLKKELITITDT